MFVLHSKTKILFSNKVGNNVRRIRNCYSPINTLFSSKRLLSCVSRKTNPEKEIIDNEVLPLKWLIGTWAGEGTVIYPEGKQEYQEIIEFRSAGQKMLIFVSNSWNKSTCNLLHKEFGFMQQKPKSNDVYFWVAHNIGYATLEAGEQTETGVINLESTNAIRGEFAKEPTVVKLKRRLKHIPPTKHTPEKLKLILDLQTKLNNIPNHLVICYHKFKKPEYIIPSSIPFINPMTTK